MRSSQPTFNSFYRFFPWLLVLLILLFVGFIRFRLLDTPLERDEGEYAYAGQLILQGIPPYKLAYNMKLPGTYYAYAFGMAAFGQTVEGIRMTLIVANSLTIVFVFLLARKLFGAATGLVSCASYTVMSVSAPVLGMMAHANHFVVLFAVPATWLLLKACESQRRWVLLASGLLYGLAFIMKQHGIFFGIFGGVFLIWHMIQNRTPAIALLKAFSIFAIGAILPFALLCLYLKSVGVFHQFWFWTFTYAHSYVSITTWSGGWHWLTMHWKMFWKLSVTLWILAILGIALGLRNKTTRRKTLFVSFLWLFSFFSAAVGLYFREHYFILVLPAFSIFIGLAVVELQRILSHAMPPMLASVLPIILFFAVFGVNIFMQRFYFSSAERLCRTLYLHVPLQEPLVISKYIKSHSSPDDKIIVLGSEPQIYFYTQRHSASGYIYAYPLVESQPYASQMQQDLIRDIETNKPKYLVFVDFKNSWQTTRLSDRAIFDWFEKSTIGIYELVGFANTHADGTTTYIWENGLKTNQEPLEQWRIAVYKRKPEIK